jgi:hypothetical protein
MLSTFIRKVPGLIPGRDTDYPDWDFRGFSQSLHTAKRIDFQLGHDLYIPFLLVHPSLITLSFDAMQSEILKAP